MASSTRRNTTASVHVAAGCSLVTEHRVPAAINQCNMASWQHGIIITPQPLALSSSWPPPAVTCCCPQLVARAQRQHLAVKDVKWGITLAGAGLKAWRPAGLQVKILNGQMGAVAVWARSLACGLAEHGPLA